MKKLLFSTLLGLATIASAMAADGEWSTDLEAAKKKAQETKKHVLIDFTGSDWCPPCKALHKNVLATEEFSKFAKDNLILVELDYPKSKPQSAELKKTNEKLAKQYKVDGFPTVLLLSPEGKEVMREVGYSGEKPAEYIAMIKKAQSAKK
jgi:protein disulfide-isomerase